MSIMQDNPVHNPRPPKKPKPSELPVYAVPRATKTSAEIISEARAAIRTVNTKRPFTPREENRRLFGNSTRPSCRPPSSFSLGSLNYDSGESRPISALRLEPLGHSPRVKLSASSTSSQDDGSVIDDRPQTSRVRLPSLPNEKGYCLENYFSVVLPDGLTAKRLHRRRHSQPVVTKQNFDFSLGERAAGDGLETSQDNVKQTSKLPTSTAVTGGHQNTKDTLSTVSETFRADDDNYYQKKIVPLLDNLFPEGREDRNEEHLLSVTKQLYDALDSGGLLRRNFTQRASILKILYKLLDSKDQSLILQLARIILAMKVKGNNLSSVCKLIFKITRNDRNDFLFLEGNLTEIFLGSIAYMNPIHDSEALVYSIGALKFLSMNSPLLRELSNLNCIDILTKLMTAINSLKADTGKLPEQVGHVLFQLTGCLRNMAEASANRLTFITSGVISQLCISLELFPEDVDIIMNIARILSKLTMNSDVCATVVSQESWVSSIMCLTVKYQTRQELVVRLAFILGNLTAKNEEARLRLFGRPNCVNEILDILQFYVSLSNSVAAEEPDNAESEEPLSDKTKGLSEAEDVVVKAIRIIANMSIHPDVGPVIASMEPCLDVILNLLDNKNRPASEELILSTLATLNNLSYYSLDKGAIADKQIEISEYLVHMLLKENPNELVEVTRVFGNLTRSSEVRNFLSHMKVLQMMVVLLDSGNKEVVYTSCGVLINFMADEDKRAVLRDEGGVRKLIDVLRDFGCSDWQLASMVCQTLWNYTTKMSSSSPALGAGETMELVNLLEEYLQESSMMDACYQEKLDDVIQEQMHDQWACIFCPVAENLLKRIEKWNV